MLRAQDIRGSGISLKYYAARQVLLQHASSAASVPDEAQLTPQNGSRSTSQARL
jgi:hypothetical protein